MSDPTRAILEIPTEAYVDIMVNNRELCAAVVESLKMTVSAYDELWKTCGILASRHGIDMDAELAKLKTERGMS